MDKTKEEKIKAFNAGTAPAPVDTKELELSKKEIIANKAADTKDAQKAQVIQDEKDAQTKEEDQKNDPILHSGNQFKKAQNAASDAVAPAVAWLANAPTPGGMATIVLVLVFFLLAVIPVDKSGNTRLKLLWLTITGKTQLSYAPGSNGGGSNFGGGNGTKTFNATTTTPATNSSNTSQLVPITSLPVPTNYNSGAGMTDIFNFLGVE